MRAKGYQPHCRFCGEPFTASRSHQRFCGPKCRLTFYKLGGVSEKRLQGLIRPVVMDFFKDERFLRELRSALDALPGPEKEIAVNREGQSSNGQDWGEKG